MNIENKIFLAGHKGLVGSAMLKILKEKGYKNIVTKNKEDLDLRNQEQVNKFLKDEHFDVIICAAAKVGGIKANSEDPASFLYDNAMIALNLIHGAIENDVKQFLFLGSSCIYPKEAQIPIKEEALLTSPLEKTNEGYALAKILGVKYIEYINQKYHKNYISVMPTNLYGPNDNYNLESSHVLPALVRKMIEAKKENKEAVYLFGTGVAKREFLYSEDLARFCLFLLEENIPNCQMNLSSGDEISIKDLAYLVKKLTGYEGKIVFNNDGLDGTLTKKLDISNMKKYHLVPSVSLEEGIKKIISLYDMEKRK